MLRKNQSTCYQFVHAMFGYRSNSGLTESLCSYWLITGYMPHSQLQQQRLFIQHDHLTAFQTTW